MSHLHIHLSLTLDFAYDPPTVFTPVRVVPNFPFRPPPLYILFVHELDLKTSSHLQLVVQFFPSLQ